MKLNERTIQVLANFQNINPSIAITPGNKIRTVSVGQGVIASATVPDEFPKSFAIHELSKFLALMSLSKENDIEFSDDYMTIQQGPSSKIKYYYIQPSLIKTLAEDEEYGLPDKYVSFSLPYALLASTMKAMQILKANMICFRGDGKKLHLATYTDASETSYSIEIGDTDKVFTATFEAEKLKLLPQDYFVTISSEGGALFSGEFVEYLITLNYKRSKFDKE